MLIFQFTGQVSVIKYSIVMYTVCFLMLTILLSFKVYFAFSKNLQGEENKDEANNELNNEQSATKKKTLSIVYLVLSALAFIFTFVMLILY